MSAPPKHIKCPLCQALADSKGPHPMDSQMGFEAYMAAIFVEGFSYATSDKVLCSNHESVINVLLRITGGVPLGTVKVGAIG